MLLLFVVIVACIISTTDAVVCTPKVFQAGDNKVKILSGSEPGECIVNSVQYSMLFNVTTDSFSVAFVGQKTNTNTFEVQGTNYTQYLNTTIWMIGGTDSNPQAITGTFEAKSLPINCNSPALWSSAFQSVSPSDVDQQSCNIHCMFNDGDNIVNVVSFNTVIPLNMSVDVGSEIAFIITPSTTAGNFSIIGIKIGDESQENKVQFEAGHCNRFLVEAPSICVRSPSQSATDPAVIDVDHRLNGIAMMGVVMGALAAFAVIVALVIVIA